MAEPSLSDRGVGHGSYHAGDDETVMAVGHGLLADEVGYVFGKLGAAAGREFLARRYAWHGPDAV